ncbi:MAG TPA: VWA domain-containing protein [Pyrinomonadaceae bacterium]|jgi:Ca-activated chloride channel family protein
MMTLVKITTAFKLIILSLAIVLFVQSPVHCQYQVSNQDKNEDIIRVDSNLVTVPTMVSTRSGLYISNLKKEDFEIYENGTPQEIAVFEPTEKPFTVFLLLDKSGSMRNNYTELEHAAKSFVEQLRPDDQIIAATFADNVDILWQTTKVKDLKKEIKIKKQFTIYTRLYDAVDFAIKKMKKIRERKAIIVFSDGLGDGVFASARDNLRAAEESEALIYTVQYNTFSEVAPLHVNQKAYSEGIVNANRYMSFLAQISGGRDFRIEKISDLDSTFGSVANELRQQYTLGYYPKQPTPGRRQIKVKLNRPELNASVRARASYVFEPKK